MDNTKRGFTIIELLVVIGIIAILASIVVVNSGKYGAKAKITRANVDAVNIGKALALFYAQYGNYPLTSSGGFSYAEFFPTIVSGGEGDPYLTVGGVNQHLSLIYRQDYAGYNASYFAKNAFYYVYLYDYDGNGTIGCGFVGIYDSPDWNSYGMKFFLRQDCNNTTDPDIQDVPFQTTHY